jgi:predicted PurR-regulated permease PerM
MAREFSLQLLGRVLVVAILALLAIWILWRFLPALGWAAVLAIATWPLRQRIVRHFTRPTEGAILLTLLVGAVIVGPLIAIIIEGAREAVLVVQWVREVRETGLGTPEWLSQVPLVGGYLAASPLRMPQESSWAAANLCRRCCGHAIWGMSC